MENKKIEDLMISVVSLNSIIQFLKVDEQQRKKLLDKTSELLNGILTILHDDYLANDYQKKAMRTCSISDNKEDMLRHGVFGLTSEAGEVAGIMQKVYQGHEFDVEHVKKELGDCLWMIAEICTALGIDLSDVMDTNITKLEARYPQGFDAEHSLHRAEGDI